MRYIEYFHIYFGADPEFFFSKDGEVVGAEKILPKDGVSEIVGWKDSSGKEPIYGKPLIVIDGVQAEFNVVPATCRQTFSENLSTCFKKLDAQMKDKGVTANFAQTVDVTEKEMKSLDKKSQQFGCAPSENAYERTKISIKDASKYMKRSAGGHIHIGKYGGRKEIDEVFKNAAHTVKLLDIIVGNTCVLLDRDEGNVERRKVYGRAGEYRLPKHGIEYRTLSNFWLRSYPTVSFVLSLTRFAMNVAADKKVSEEILSRVQMHRVEKAINTNDFALAHENFTLIKDILKDIAPEDGPTYPLQGRHMEQFEYFMEKGLDVWFKNDIMTHWINHNYRLGHLGWEEFLGRTVAPKSELSMENVSRPKTIEATLTLISHA